MIDLCPTVDQSRNDATEKSIMTEPNPGKEPTGDQQPAVRHDEPDFVLQLLAKAAHDGVAEVGITVSLGGAIVSGILVGRVKWFRELATYAESQGEGFGTIPRAIGELFAEDDEADGPEGIPVSNFGFIHLKDARVIAGSAAMPHNRGMFWRCQLSQVSGWSLGTLAPS